MDVQLDEQQMSERKRVAALVVVVVVKYTQNCLGNHRASLAYELFGPAQWSHFLALANRKAEPQTRLLPVFLASL